MNMLQGLAKGIFIMQTVLLAGMISARAEIAVSNCLEEDEHIGIALGADASTANANAVARCIARGGDNQCCEIYATIRKGSSGTRQFCVAGAQGNNGDFGYGVAGTRARATQAAIQSCRESAIAPKQCKAKGDVVCSPQP
jgi:hypothetical protein